MRAKYTSCVSFLDSPELDYLGCWIDNPNNRILSDLYSNRRKDINWYNIGETVLNCARDAANSSKDYNLFAVQYFGECWSEEGNPDYKKMRGSPEGCQFGMLFLKFSLNNKKARAIHQNPQGTFWLSHTRSMIGFEDCKYLSTHNKQHHGKVLSVISYLIVNLQDP